MDDLARLIPHLREAFPAHAFTPKSARLLAAAPRYGKIIPGWDVISQTLTAYLRDNASAIAGPFTLAREAPKLIGVDGREPAPDYQPDAAEQQRIRDMLAAHSREMAAVAIARSEARPAGASFLTGDQLRRARERLGAPGHQPKEDRDAD